MEEHMPVGFVQVSGDEKEASELRAKMNALMEQARATFAPLQQQPPALFSQEQLEQIRAVVREEFNRTYQDTAYWEKLTEEQKNAVNEWRSLTGQMLAAKAAQFHRQHPELHILFDFRSDVTIKEDIEK